MIKKILGITGLLALSTPTLANGWDWEYGFKDSRWSTEELEWVQEVLTSHPPQAQIRALLPPPSQVNNCPASGCADPVELLDNYVLYLHGLKPNDPVPVAPEYPLGCTTDCIY